MTVAIATVGLLILVLGVVGLVRPTSLIGLVDRAWMSRTGLYVAIAFRAALGILLVAAASSTRFPWVIGALGVLSLIAAVLIPVLGYDRIRGFVEWWAARPTGVVRIWACAACAFGGFLIYAAV